MRIVVPTWTVDERKGGIRTFLGNLVDALRRQPDVELTLLCSREQPRGVRGIGRTARARGSRAARVANGCARSPSSGSAHASGPDSEMSCSLRRTSGSSPPGSLKSSSCRRRWRSDRCASRTVTYRWTLAHRAVPPDDARPEPAPGRWGRGGHRVDARSAHPECAGTRRAAGARRPRRRPRCRLAKCRRSPRRRTAPPPVRQHAVPVQGSRAPRGCARPPPSRPSRARVDVSHRRPGSFGRCDLGGASVAHRCPRDR